MFDAQGLVSLTHVGLATLSIIAIWMGQMTQARLDRLAKETVTDVLILRAEIGTLRNETRKDIQKLNHYLLSISQQVEGKSSRVVH